MPGKAKPHVNISSASQSINQKQDIANPSDKDSTQDEYVNMMEMACHVPNIKKKTVRSVERHPEKSPSMTCKFQQITPRASPGSRL